MAQSEAEGPNFLKYWFLSLKFGLKLDNDTYLSSLFEAVWKTRDVDLVYYNYRIKEY